MQTVKLFVGHGSQGSPVYEELPAVQSAERVYRLAASPGLLIGLAKDDEVEVDSSTGSFKLLRRGGNIAIQVYLAPSGSDVSGALQKEMQDQLGATLDGLTDKQAVFSVSATKGFSAIENVLNKFVLKNPGAEWYYGNVYADDGVTPLNWWRES